MYPLPKDLHDILNVCYEEVDEVFRKYGIYYYPGCGCCGGTVLIKDSDGKEWEGELRGFGGEEKPHDNHVS